MSPVPCLEWHESNRTTLPRAPKHGPVAFALKSCVSIVATTCTHSVLGLLGLRPPSSGDWHAMRHYYHLLISYAHMAVV